MIFTAFDLDGTLIDSHELIFDELDRIGYTVDRDDISEYDIKHIEGNEPPVDFQWDLFFYRLFVEKWDLIGPVDDYVSDFLSLVYGDGSEVIKVVTARPLGALIHNATSMTLGKIFPDIDFSIDVVSTSDKFRYLQGYNIVFEDRRRTCIDLAERGKLVFMIDRTYNQIEPTDVDIPIIYISELSGRDPYASLAGTIVRFRNYREVLELPKGVMNFCFDPALY